MCAVQKPSVPAIIIDIPTITLLYTGVCVFRYKDDTCFRTHLSSASYYFAQEQYSMVCQDQRTDITIKTRLGFVKYEYSSYVDKLPYTLICSWIVQIGLIS